MSVNSQQESEMRNCLLYIYIFLKKYYTPKRLDTLLLHLEVQPVIQVDNFPVIRLSR